MLLLLNCQPLKVYVSKLLCSQLAANLVTFAGCQVVFEFLHGRLVGEGGLMKHLQHIGYKLAYTQSPLMEYPFAVTNLAVDLRDGLRLIKVAEVLTGVHTRAE